MKSDFNAIDIAAIMKTAAENVTAMEAMVETPSVKLIGVYRDNYLMSKALIQMYREIKEISQYKLEYTLGHDRDSRTFDRLDKLRALVKS